MNWEEVPADYAVSLGERVRVEYNDHRDEAHEVTADEAMEGTEIRHLFNFKGYSPERRYYTVAPVPEYEHRLILCDSCGKKVGETIHAGTIDLSILTLPDRDGDVIASFTEEPS